MEPIEVVTDGPCTVEIYPETDPVNPREYDCNLGKMVCFHRRYILGDKTDLRQDQFNSWGDLKDYLSKELDAVAILPLYMLDHSGISIRTSPFGDPWDSGQIGFIYVDAAGLKNEYKKVNKSTIAKALKVLEGEVITYNQYVTGDVYGYVLKEFGKEVDSCWGYFGLDYMREEAARLAREHNKREETKTLFGGQNG